MKKDKTTDNEESVAESQFDDIPHSVTHTDRKKKNLIFFFLLTLGFTFCTLNVLQLVYVINKTRSSVEQNYIDDCKEIASGYSLALSHTVSEYRKQLDRYVLADVVQSGDEEKIVDWLISHSNTRSSDFDYIFFCGSDGVAHTDTGIDVNVADRTYFKAIMQDGKNTYVDDPVISRSTGKAIIHIVRAVKLRGKTIGFFSGVIPVEAIQQAVGKIKLGDTGFAWVLSGNGIVIAHQNKDLVMKTNFLTGLKTEHEDLIDLAKHMTTGKNGTVWVIDFDGKKKCVVYTPVVGTDWSFAFAVADSQVHATAIRLTRTMIVTALIILIVLLLISGLIIFYSLKPLQIVESTITGIASGSADLTKRIEIKSNNEIGSVVSGFNKFTAKLQSIIAELKRLERVLSTAGEDLRAGAQDTSASISQILTNIETVGGHITSQAAGVEETAGAVNEIASNIGSLEHMIETQASGVTQASAAVEQMIGNIKSVEVSVEKMAESFTALEKNALDGASKQQDVNERIEQIENESEMLQEANSVIAGIAEQTNLLAMNAAIEAAHAGEAGKGFSVVSDEIRKLSETSTSQSKTIGEQLNRIKDSIGSVVSASEDSSAAFNAVSSGIHDTDVLVKQIKEAMEEQQEGSKQITAALHSMNDSTTEVRTASSEMSAGNRAILDEIKNLQESTMEMKDSMSEMKTGAKKINETGTALTNIADKVWGSIQKIDDQINQFKV